jgi:TRAP-type C4-dicarboxylate transport system substrate-binding protein
MRNLCSFRVAMLALAFLIAPAAAWAKVTLIVSSWVPPTHTVSQTMAKWCEEVAKATENRVVCSILPKAVSAPPATFDSIRDALADVSFGTPGYTPGRFVLTQIAELPFAGDSAEVNSVAYQRIYERYLAPLDEYKGLKVLTVFTHGPGGIYNNKRPIRSVQDLQGLKFRVGGGMVNEIGKALGANVTVKPATESYELLSTGVMDGVFFPAESIASFKLEKLLRYRTDFPGGLYNTSFAFVMNADTWRRIPKADQEIIARLSGEQVARMFGRGWDEADARGVAAMNEAGVQMLQADKSMVEDVRKRTAPLEQKWIAEAKAAGLADPALVLREFRAEVAKAAKP